MILSATLYVNDSLRADGGHVLRELGELLWSPLSADLVDRFGVCWYLFVTLHRPKET